MSEPCNCPYSSAKERLHCKYSLNCSCTSYERKSNHVFCNGLSHIIDNK